MIPQIKWGAETLDERGVIVSGYNNKYKNAIGAPFGPFCINRALGISTKVMQVGLDTQTTGPNYFLERTSFRFKGDKIVTLDPWGGLSGNVVSRFNSLGINLYPSIARCKARLKIREVEDAIKLGYLENDDHFVRDGRILVTKFSIDPVWHLPGVANRLQVTEKTLRTALYDATGGGYPELLNNPELQVFLPPYGGTTVYCIGDLDKLEQPSTKIGVRVHDECNSSDVFGSTICTCRSYLMFALIEMAKLAQNGGVGILVYSRQEGKGFGEVSKFQVYRSRDLSAHGQNAEFYYSFTSKIHQATDLRFHEFCCDPLLWLGITHIDYLYSMSPTKYSALLNSGIRIINRVDLPDEVVDSEALPEITAKKLYGGYYSSHTATKVGLEVLSCVKNPL